MLDYAKFLISRRLYKSDQKRMFRRRFFKEGRMLDHRTIEGYFARARQLLVAEAGRTKDDMRVDSISFWESIVSGPQSTLRDRMYGQERLDKIAGVEAPFRHKDETEDDGRPTELCVKFHIVEPGAKPNGETTPGS